LTKSKKNQKKTTILMKIDVNKRFYAALCDHLLAYCLSLVTVVAYEYRMGNDIGIYVFVESAGYIFAYILFSKVMMALFGKIDLSLFELYFRIKPQGVGTTRIIVRDLILVLFVFIVGTDLTVMNILIYLSLFIPITSTTTYAVFADLPFKISYADLTLEITTD
jgi:hypothetical protein